MKEGRILCTEDDKDTREMLVVFLQNSGYQVVCPADGTRALDLAQRQAFDLFLIDNWMPDQTGIELTQAIRQFNQSTPILFYSGAAAESDKREALGAGAQGYLTKPAGIIDLVDEVERLVGLAKQS